MDLSIEILLGSWRYCMTTLSCNSCDRNLLTFWCPSCGVMDIWPHSHPIFPEQLRLERVLDQGYELWIELLTVTHLDPFIFVNSVYSVSSRLHSISLWQPPSKPGSRRINFCSPPALAPPHIPRRSKWLWCPRRTPRGVVSCVCFSSSWNSSDEVGDITNSRKLSSFQGFSCGAKYMMYTDELLWKARESFVANMYLNTIQNLMNRRIFGTLKAFRPNWNKCQVHICIHEIE